jgi:3'-phosphoadenosine 5'-phosphosulfate sulfotransferase (PAPS reductase)/FAD synthetase
MRTIVTTQEVDALLARHAPVIVGVSGGKDSHAVAWALAEHLKGYAGPKALIHSDLGSVEWLDSLPACQRIADRIGWELIVCARPAGGMMERWEARWQSSIRRYCAMETVAVVLPWSTPTMRFCTSELKVGPITSAIKKRFGNKTPAINVTGVRAEESANRAKQPIVSAAEKLPDGSLSWRPIHQWLLQDVWDAIAESGVAAHEAYSLFGSSRVSCRFCILANEADLRASLRDPAAAAIYVRMCELELLSGFAFQGSRWLTSLAPDLVPNGAVRLLAAKGIMALRKDVEAWLPKHLQFKRGWPHCIPTEQEAKKLAEMRREICALYGWDSPYLTADAIRDRYQELMLLKEAKAAKKKRK